MNTIGCFESPFGMYELTKGVLFRYCKGASEEDFIFLVFLLTHLREHIVEGKKHGEFDNISHENRTKGENLFIKLHNNDEFNIIRDICNGTKHYKIDKKLLAIKGFICGLSRCGDRLDQRYFLIDGKDSRSIFLNVFNQYRIFFEGDVAS